MIESSFHAHEDEKYLTACQALGADPIHNADTAVWRVVISKDGHTLAVGAMREITPSEYRIDQLEVLKEVRCQKLGKYALLYLETKARSIGGKIMSVEAPTDLVPYSETRLPLWGRRGSKGKQGLVGQVVIQALSDLTVGRDLETLEGQVGAFGNAGLFPGHFDLALDVLDLREVG